MPTIQAIKNELGKLAASDTAWRAAVEILAAAPGFMLKVTGETSPRVNVPATLPCVRERQTGETMPLHQWDALDIAARRSWIETVRKQKPAVPEYTLGG